MISSSVSTKTLHRTQCLPEQNFPHSTRLHQGNIGYLPMLYPTHNHEVFPIRFPLFPLTYSHIVHHVARNEVCSVHLLFKAYKTPNLDIIHSPVFSLADNRPLLAVHPRIINLFEICKYVVLFIRRQNWSDIRLTIQQYWHRECLSSKNHEPLWHAPKTYHHRCNKQ